MAWSEIKYSINESLGNSNFLPLNKLIYNRTPLGLDGYTSYYSNTSISTLNQNIEVVNVLGEGYLSYAIIYLTGNRNVNLTITVDDQIIFQSTNGHYNDGTGANSSGIANLLYIKREDKTFLIGESGTRGNLIPLTPNTKIATGTDNNIRCIGNDFYFKKSLKIVVKTGTATTLNYLYHVKNL